MTDDKITTIIAADYMYIVFIGSNEELGKIINKLNTQENNKKNKDIYLLCSITEPCINMLDGELIRGIADNKYVILDEGVETTQCLIYADISSNDSSNAINNMSLMMVINTFDSYYKLSYPILQLEEEENPDKLIRKWLIDHNLTSEIKELTIRPVNIVGNEHDILVFSASL